MIAKTSECWRFIEHLTWRYKYIQDNFAYIVDFFIENIYMAPSFSSTSFDALMSTISDRDDIKEIIARYYIDSSGTHLGYDVFVKNASVAIQVNKKALGESWLLDRMIDLRASKARLV